MTAETSLYSALDANVGLEALVANRIYPDVLPEGIAYPAVVFSRTKTDPIPSISGQSFGADVDLAIAAWGTTRTSVDAVAAAIENALTNSGFVRVGRESAVDPESGLFAATLTYTFFEI